MAKSIRSKGKRKHRTEFRNTVGTVAYNKQFEKLQEKLKNCVEKQSTSLEGLQRLSKQLGNSDPIEPQVFDGVKNDSSSMAIDGEVADALDTTTTGVKKDERGENKAPRVKARGGRKYSYMHKAKGKPREKPEKKQPKYFCAF